MESCFTMSIDDYLYCPDEGKYYEAIDAPPDGSRKVLFVLFGNRPIPQ